MVEKPPEPTMLMFTLDKVSEELTRLNPRTAVEVLFALIVWFGNTKDVAELVVIAASTMPANPNIKIPTNKTTTLVNFCNFIF